jgi:hypothetical protein
MSIMNLLFGTKQAAPQPDVTNNPANNPPPKDPVAEGATPPSGESKPQEDQSPLKQFEALWQPNKTDNSNGTPPEKPVTTETFMEAAGKVDFTKVLDNESLQKIQAGGDDAVKALAGLLNKTAQTVFGQSTAVAHKLAEQVAAQTRDELMAQIPNMIKKQTAGDSLLDENPAFKNPALAPVVSALQQQFQEKYPAASAKEINKMTQEYLQGAANVINPPKASDSPRGRNSKASDDAEDWTKYLQS